MNTHGFNEIDRRLVRFSLNGSMTMLEGSTQLAFVASRCLPRTDEVIHCLDMFAHAVDNGLITTKQAHDALYIAIMGHYRTRHPSPDTRRDDPDDWLGDERMCPQAIALASFSLTPGSGLLPDTDGMNDGKWALVSAIGASMRQWDHGNGNHAITGVQLCDAINAWDETRTPIPSRIPYVGSLIRILEQYTDTDMHLHYLMALGGLDDSTTHALQPYDAVITDMIPDMDPDIIAQSLPALASMNPATITIYDVRIAMRIIRDLGMDRSMERNPASMSSEPSMHISYTIGRGMDLAWTSGGNRDAVAFTMMTWACITIMVHHIAHPGRPMARPFHDISPSRLHECITMPMGFTVEDIRINGWD